MHFLTKLSRFLFFEKLYSLNDFLSVHNKPHKYYDKNTIISFWKLWKTEMIFHFFLFVTSHVEDETTLILRFNIRKEISPIFQLKIFCSTECLLSEKFELIWIRFLLRRIKRNNIVKFLDRCDVEKIRKS